MFRNYFLINVFLIIFIGFLGFKFYRVITYSVEMPSGTGLKAVEEDDRADKTEARRLNVAAFNVISQKDLFRPSRTPSESKAGGTAKTLPKDQPKLFGTIILDNNKTAILEDPGTKTTKSYRINDSVAGYVISDIQEDKVILLMGGEKIEVKLRENKGVKSKARTTRKPANRRQIKRRTPRRTPRPVPTRKSNTSPEDVERLMREEMR
jgi:type II secretory pathway component PulC